MMAVQIDVMDDDTDYVPSESDDDDDDDDNDKDNDEDEDYEPPNESMESLPGKNILIYNRLLNVYPTKQFLVSSSISGQLLHKCA